MFGREARLPIDLCFGVATEDAEGLQYQQYITKLRTDLDQAYQLAREAADKNHARNKRAYDSLVRDQVLQKGDRVLLRNYGVPGKHKLQNKWRSSPYVVVGKMRNLPVHQVKPESGTGAIRTVHRKHLLPIGYLVRMPTDPEEVTHCQRRGLRAQRQSVAKQSLGGWGSPATWADMPSSSNVESEINAQFSTVGVGQNGENALPAIDLLDTSHDFRVAEGDDVALVGDTGEVGLAGDVIANPESTVDGNLPPSSASVEAAGLEGGADLPTVGGVVPESGLPNRPRRERWPVMRFTYDELGRPSDLALGILSRGVRVGYGAYDGYRSCLGKIMWCHPMAFCPSCVR